MMGEALKPFLAGEGLKASPVNTALMDITTFLNYAE